MSLINPYGLLGLILIPLIILMYILKQSFEETKVSSTFLWDLATKEEEVNTPWQKLKKNILMLLQIIIALLLVLALSKPIFYQNKMINSPEILIIDNSGSMSAIYEGNETRLERAKSMAIEHIDTLAKGTPITLLSIGGKVEVIMADEADRDKLVASINGIEQSQGSDMIVDNLEFIGSLSKNYEANTLIAFTDDNIDSPMIETAIVNSVGSNISIDYINTFIKEDGSYEAMVKLTNRYKNKETVNLQIFDSEDKLVELVEVELDGYVSKNISIDNIRSEGEFIYGQIKEDDLIAGDNLVYATLNRDGIKKILLISDGNVFIEKAIMASGKYELYKTDTAEDIPSGYDLYIYDGINQINTPTSGSMLFIGADNLKDYGINVGKESSGYGVFQNTIVSKYVREEEFAVSKYNTLDGNKLTPVATIGSETIIGIGNMSGRKYGVFAFDIHDSDLALSMSFPVVVDRMLGYLMGEVSTLAKEYYATQEIEFEPYNTTTEASMVLPDGSDVKVQLSYPVTYFTETDTLGIYVLKQMDSEGKEREDYLKVSFPIKTESDIKDIEIATDDINISQVESRKVKTDLTNILILLILLISIYEWKKYVRG